MRLFHHKINAAMLMQAAGEGKMRNERFYSASLEVTVKIHGYADEGLKFEEIVPSELAEITLVANPEELRRIAKFLENCANGMETRGKSWEHEHLCDRDSYFQDSPHFVVFNPGCGQ